MFNTDKPILLQNEDLLKRSNFSQKLADAILSYTEIDNFTISICGKWGSGKTSIINMVKETIKNRYNESEFEKAPIIIDFNPWNYSDQDQLISQFFSTLSVELKKKLDKNSFKVIGDALQNYAAAFTYAELIPVLGKYLKPIKSLINGLGKASSNYSDSKNNLEYQKKRVIEALKKQSKKFIIVIDDIDRLNNSQIRLIFQLVNNLAGFPNMIYLLSFDREIVVRALSDEQNCNGEEYLEKIIQVPFDIPEVKQEYIENILFEKLDKLWFCDGEEESFDKEYWGSVFNHCISPFIKGIRDVNRIINVYQFKYPLMKNETNAIDLLAVTVLQIFFPKVYLLIRNNTSLFTSNYPNYSSRSSAEETKNKELEVFNELYPGRSELILEFLQVLFPCYSKKTNRYYGGYIDNDEMRRLKRIACPSRTELYFTLSLEDVAVPNETISKMINQLDEDEIKTQIIKMYDNNTLRICVNELIANANSIPRNRLGLFLKVSIIMQNEFYYDQKQKLFDSSLFYDFRVLSWKITEEMGDDLAKEEYIKLIESKDVIILSIISILLLEIECSYGRINRGAGSHKVIKEGTLDTITKEYLRIIKEVSSYDNLFNGIDFEAFYYLLKYLDEDFLKKYLINAMENPVNVPKLIVLGIQYWHGNNNQGYSFKENNFSDYITDENTYKKILSLKGTKEFSELTLKNKKVAIAYVVWYESDEKDGFEVSFDTIEEKLNEWEKH